MTHRLTTNYATNYCNLTFIVKVIVENGVTCFLGTQCIMLTLCHRTLILTLKCIKFNFDDPLEELTVLPRLPS